MTIKEAIRILEDGSWWDLLLDDAGDASMNLLHDALDVAIAALREQDNRLESDAVKNEPLTLEELRQMDGEPVWMEDNQGNKFWGLVSVEDDGAVYCIDNETGLWEYYFYGDTFASGGWLAYRSKPKEDAQ